MRTTAYFRQKIQSLKAILLYHFLEWHFTFLALINGHLFSSNTSVYAKVNQCETTPNISIGWLFGLGWLSNIQTMLLLFRILAASSIAKQQLPSCAFFWKKSKFTSLNSPTAHSERLGFKKEYFEGFWVPWMHLVRYKDCMQWLIIFKEYTSNFLGIL